jgi:hypothetical protein
MAAGPAGRGVARGGGTAGVAMAMRRRFRRVQGRDPASACAVATLVGANVGVQHADGLPTLPDLHPHPQRHQLPSGGARVVVRGAETVMAAGDSPPAVSDVDPVMR